MQTRKASLYSKFRLPYPNDLMKQPLQKASRKTLDAMGRLNKQMNPGGNTNKSSSDSRICYNCEERGHIRPNCTKINESRGRSKIVINDLNKRVMYRQMRKASVETLNSMNAISEKMGSDGGTNKSSSDSRLCYNCKEIGHIKPNCTKQRKLGRLLSI